MKKVDRICKKGIENIIKKAEMKHRGTLRAFGFKGVTVVNGMPEK